MIPFYPLRKFGSDFRSHLKFGCTGWMGVYGSPGARPLRLRRGAIIENFVSITDSSVTCAINEETTTKLKRTSVLIPKTIPGQQAPGPRGFRRRGPFRAARVLARRAPFLASPITGDTKW